MERWEDALRKLASSERLPHALLVAGPGGSGRQDLARMAAGLVLCEEARSCGSCGACARAATGSHPDLLVIEPDDKGVIRLDSVAERAGESDSLSGFLQVATFEGRGRAALMLGADALTRPAQQACLKSLEEPPPDTLLVLVAQGTQEFLPTILSRVQVMRVPGWPVDRMGDHPWLEHLPQDQALVLGRWSSGDPALAVELEQAGALGVRRALGDWWSGSEQSWGQAMAAPIPEGRQGASLAARTALAMCLDGLRCSHGVAPDRTAHGTLLPDDSPLAWEKAVAACIRAVENLDRNSHADLVLHNLREDLALIRMAEVEPT